MTSIPRPELITLVVAMTDAEDLAAEGNPADGYTALLAGLHRAREAEADGEEWGAALDLGEKARREIRGHDLAHYVDRLERVRAKTLDELAQRDDAWLEEEAPFSEGRPANNYFKWFHVFEDELNHRGQIRWLRKSARC